jgi:hypothetical protein
MEQTCSGNLFLFIIIINNCIVIASDSKIPITSKQLFRFYFHHSIENLSSTASKMKFTSSIVIALGAAATASPLVAPRQNSAIGGAISQWLTDITVNNPLHGVSPQYSRNPLTQLIIDRQRLP